MALGCVNSRCYAKGHLLGRQRFFGLDRGMVLIDCLEDLSVSVGRFDERLALALKNFLGTGSLRINEGDDLESRAKLVFETE